MMAVDVQALYAKDGVVRLSAKKPLLYLIGFCLLSVGLGLSPPLGATVILTTGRASFQSSNPILSIDTFDEFHHPTQFPLANESVTIDLITYFDPTSTPRWRLDQISITSSPRNSLLASLSAEENIITWDQSSFVHAFGLSLETHVQNGGEL